MTTKRKWSISENCKHSYSHVLPRTIYQLRNVHIQYTCKIWKGGKTTVSIVKMWTQYINRVDGPVIKVGGSSQTAKIEIVIFYLQRRKNSVSREICVYMCRCKGKRKGEGKGMAWHGMKSSTARQRVGQGITKEKETDLWMSVRRSKIVWPCLCHSRSVLISVLPGSFFPARR